VGKENGEAQVDEENWELVYQVHRLEGEHENGGDVLGKIQQQGLNLLLLPPDSAFVHATIHYPSMQSQPGQPLLVGSRPSDHYFRSVCLSVCAEFFSAVFDPIWIKLGHMLHVRV